MTDTKIKRINQPGDYYFCSLCSKWHTDARKDHLQYRLHIQHFNRKNGFSFIIKGLKIAEIKVGSGDFIDAYPEHPESGLHECSPGKKGFRAKTTPSATARNGSTPCSLRKCRRNKQFGREHIDILAKDQYSKALVVAAYIDPDWIKDENISIKGITPF